jgi:3-dehydroquinate synthetase
VVTDVGGFAAAIYHRGVPVVHVPTTLLGQVDAAIGGKTGIDIPEGKNLVGAFHWPARTVVDPTLLETLPEPQRVEGMAEVVKAGLLAGESFWELPLEELVRRTGAYKAAICLRDPFERDERTVLNLGHTFAHALEAAAGYEGVTHGRAVALGLLAALRLSGCDTSVVEQVLRPQPVRVDRERAWEAMRRDKKVRSGEIRLVLLGAEGPEQDVVLPEADVRRELDRLIA